MNLLRASRVLGLIRQHPDSTAAALILAVLWVLLALFGGRLQIETVRRADAGARPGSDTAYKPELTVVGGTGGTTANGVFTPVGDQPASLEFQFTKRRETTVNIVVGGYGLGSIGAWPQGASGYRELRSFPAGYQASGRLLTITGLPEDASWVKLRLTLRPVIPDSVGQTPSISAVSVDPLPAQKSLLPSLTLVAFIALNYLVLRAWLSPIRALAIHAAFIVLVFTAPTVMRTTVPWLLAAELALLVRSAWPITKNLDARLAAPFVTGIALLAVVVAAPWVYNLAGDYITQYDTQWGTVTHYRDAGLHLFNFRDFVIDRVSPQPLFFPPGYPLLFGLFYKMFGPIREAITVVNMAGLASLVVATYLLAWRLSGKTFVGLLAALFVALWPDFSLAAARTQPEFLAAVFAVWAFVSFVFGLRRGPISMIIPGVLAAASAYMRGEFLLLPLALGVAALLTLRGKGRKHAAVIVVVSFLLVLPWTARNYVRFHAFVPMNVGNGLSLILGVAQVQSSGELGLVESDYWVGQNDGMTDKPYWDPARERNRAVWALSLIKNNFSWYVTHLPRRWVRWAHAENDIYVRGNPDVFSRDAVSYDITWQRLVYDSTKGLAQRAVVIGAGPATKVVLLFVFVTGCVWMILKRRWRDLVLYAMIPAYLFVMFTPFRIEARYLIAAWPVIAAVCAALIASLFAPDGAGATATASV